MKLRNDINKIGFKVNPYDPCVANMQVNDDQITLTWHVDDMKISHINPNVIESFIYWMRDKYETVRESKVKVS